MIEKIYSFIGSSPEIMKVETDAGLVDDHSVMTVDANTGSMAADIFVERSGRDLVREVADHLKKLCRDKFMTIYVHLRLSDPMTSLLSKEIEKLGFFFAGIKPGSGNGDVLILQFLNNHTIDYDYIATGCSDSEEILDYVRKLDMNYQDMDQT
jgi:serine/threonine-protein kinase RsbW